MSWENEETSVLGLVLFKYSNRLANGLVNVWECCLYMVNHQLFQCNESVILRRGEQHRQSMEEIMCYHSQQGTRR